MSRVKNKGTAKPAQHWDGPHVRHQIIVAESRAAFGDENSFPTGLLRLLDDLAHFRR